MNQERDKILCDIRKKLIDIKKLYGHNMIKFSASVPGNLVDPEKVKIEIKEYL